ncbi:YlqD family protein [Megamonas hypermegale]|uniref:YlqD family protein n=1 Tax=Megamonas hypermegale TaxID=158847 RepID=UPI00195E036C|nr:YlqD family protein [Megamonas hypermegale]MBM6760545.1 YlqD family protein [Megamonas hypermegale]
MENISLQCPVTIKVKVTEKFRNKMLDKMNKELEEVNLKLSKIDIQRKKFIEEHEQDNPQQVAAIVQRMEVDKAKGLKVRDKLTQDIADMKHLGLGAEIIQGTMHHILNVKVGDKMPEVMNSEIVIEDGKIIEIRN